MRQIGRGEAAAATCVEGGRVARRGEGSLRCARCSGAHFAQMVGLFARARPARAGGSALREWEGLSLSTGHCSAMRGEGSGGGGGGVCVGEQCGALSPALEREGVDEHL